MHEHAAHPPTAAPLHLCAACGEPFVVPRELLGPADGARHVVHLCCDNCGWSDVAPHALEDLERLDRALDRQTAQIVAAIELFATAHDLDRIDRFVRALRDDLILPEDF
jgi:hypothetical protein